MTPPSSVFSNSVQQSVLQQIIVNYLRLPFAAGSVPGSLLEASLATVCHAQVLRTYDFIDVLAPALKTGWQVKSTKATTPVTWMRAKIPDKQRLIEQSIGSEEGCQRLGDAILDYSNAHVLASLKRYQLERIGYVRLVALSDSQLMYFERELVTSEQPILFVPDEYVWHWSTPKRTEKKEQLPAFVGRHTQTKGKHFAWHGQGENQLHFTGERSWWPPSGDVHRMDFAAPDASQQVSFETVAAWLTQLPRL